VAEDVAVLAVVLVRTFPAARAAQTEEGTGDLFDGQFGVDVRGDVVLVTVVAERTVTRSTRHSVEHIDDSRCYRARRVAQLPEGKGDPAASRGRVRG